MNIREIAGLILIIAGVAITPLGWTVSHKLLVIAVALIAVGAALFWTARVMKRQERIEREQSGGGSYGAPVSGDINNSTGWLSGGRTKTIESATSERDADSD